MVRCVFMLVERYADQLLDTGMNAQSPVSPSSAAGGFNAGMGLMHVMPSFLHIGQRHAPQQHGPHMLPGALPGQEGMIPAWPGRPPEIPPQHPQHPQWNGVHDPRFQQWTPHDPPQF